MKLEMRNEKLEVTIKKNRPCSWNLTSYFSLPTSYFRRGFTLIELLIVLAIIGTLTSFIMVNFMGARERARDAERKSDMQQMRSAFELYRADQGAYPPAPLPACGGSLVNGGSTYLQTIPCDPMNEGQHVYTYTTNGTTYSIIACLENEKDQQKDPANNTTYCSGTDNWSYTLMNP